jgi:hypothetical protein
LQPIVRVDPRPLFKSVRAISARHTLCSGSGAATAMSPGRLPDESHSPPLSSTFRACVTFSSAPADIPLLARSHSDDRPHKPDHRGRRSRVAGSCGSVESDSHRPLDRRMPACSLRTGVCAATSFILGAHDQETSSPW